MILRRAEDFGDHNFREKSCYRNLMVFNSAKSGFFPAATEIRNCDTELSLLGKWVHGNEYFFPSLPCQDLSSSAKSCSTFSHKRHWVGLRETCPILGARQLEPGRAEEGRQGAEHGRGRQGGLEKACPLKLSLAKITTHWFYFHEYFHLWANVVVHICLCKRGRSWSHLNQWMFCYWC